MLSLPVSALHLQLGPGGLCAVEWTVEGAFGWRAALGLGRALAEQPVEELATVAELLDALKAVRPLYAPFARAFAVTTLPAGLVELLATVQRPGGFVASGTAELLASFIDVWASPSRLWRNCTSCCSTARATSSSAIGTPRRSRACSPRW